MSAKPIALSFNARNVKPSTAEQVAIPAGWYNTKIVKGEVKATKGANAGSQLLIYHEVLDGEHQGNVLIAKFTMENSSEKAVEIGQQDLSALCHATGVMDVSNDQAFNNIRVQAKAGFEKQTAAEVAKYGEKNKVKGWKAMEGATPAAAYIPTQAAPVTQPVSALPTVSNNYVIPEGWTVHPQDPSYYFKGSEVLTLDVLMVKHPAPSVPAAPAGVPAAPAAPSAPSVPAAPAGVPAAPLPPAPVAVFPPAGWLPHPSAPGYFYQGQEVVDEATLRARLTTPVTASEIPPWEQ